MDSTWGVTITPRKWPSITPITSLFRFAIDLYNTQLSKIWEKFLEKFGKTGKIWKIWGNFWKKLGKIWGNFWKNWGNFWKNLGNLRTFGKFLEKIWKNWEKKQKIDFNEGGGSAIYLYNTHLSKIRARQWPAITPITRKITKKRAKNTHHPNSRWVL